MSYKELKSYQQATIIFDFTFEFCNRYIAKISRTFDQMIQAARSGKQNIVEGSAYRTSEKSELRLLDVARGSFAELLEDFGDFLRQRNLPQWDKNDSRSLEIRNKSDRSYLSYQSYLNAPETAANAAICLINQVNYLLDRQIKSAEKQFIAKGDYQENIIKKRKEFTGELTPRQVLALRVEREKENDAWLQKIIKDQKNDQQS